MSLDSNKTVGIYFLRPRQRRCFFFDKQIYFSRALESCRRYVALSPRSCLPLSLCHFPWQLATIAFSQSHLVVSLCKISCSLPIEKAFIMLYRESRKVFYTFTGYSASHPTHSNCAQFLFKIPQHSLGLYNILINVAQSSATFPLHQRAKFISSHKKAKA